MYSASVWTSCATSVLLHMCVQASLHVLFGPWFCEYRLGAIRLTWPPKNTQHDETHNTMKHTSWWNAHAQHVETHSTMKHTARCNTQHGETHNTMQHTTRWNTEHDQTHSADQHAAWHGIFYIIHRHNESDWHETHRWNTQVYSYLPFII